MTRHPLVNTLRAAAGASLLWAGAATAQSVTLTYEGELSDLAGAAVSADLEMTFALYALADGGEPVWTEAEQVAVVDGRFTAVLGDDMPFPLVGAEGVLYLGVQVGDDVEQTPRMRVGGALRARLADRALQADDVAGRDIHPASVSIGELPVIDNEGRWVGDPTGLIGPAGPQGEDGQAGPAGPQGEDGQAGPIGPQGEPGPAGPQGEEGPAGPIGPQGEPGPAGPQGEEGPAGPIGPRGDEGPAGPIGPQGDEGPVGPIGPQGEPGPAGPRGDEGPAGPIGPQGEPGPAGPRGDEGPQGEQGPAGPVGAAGPIGPQGAVGPAGPQGEPGPRGDIGPVGPAGPQGEQGPQGVQGPEGPAGTFELPDRVDAIFGAGPIALYNGANWRLDATDADTLTITQTAAGFIPMGIIHPSNCGINTSATAQKFRFTSAAGQTLSADLCLEGSTALVTIWSSADDHPATIRCLRYTGNHIRCQRML